MDFWAQILSRVAERIDQQSFDTWFRPASLHGLDDDTVRIRVPNENFRRCLLENYSALILECAAAVTGKELRLEVLAADSSAARAPAAPTPPPQLPTLPVNINPRYTFDSFVVGSSNQFACAAAQAVSERPARAYNPLYIYGGVGLGKTHLMHAIAHFIHHRNRSLKLTYMSSERFMNELVNAIRYDRTIQFREKYRSIDVLLMDDIQFIAKWERTQEEFFHTFNALYDAQKQIVITSDCPPRGIPTIEERLHSRFEWGLIADIQHPDFETKIAILKKKSESLRMTLADDVAAFLAKSVRSNVRELEGALVRLSARASLDGKQLSEIDTAYAKDVLKNIITGERLSVTGERILQAVAAFYGLTAAQLKAKNNARPVAQPRQIAMYVCKELTRLSLPEIGRVFGGKHHTTVLHSVRKIQNLRKSDPRISADVSSIMHSLR